MKQIQAERNEWRRKAQKRRNFIMDLHQKFVTSSCDSDNFSVSKHKQSRKKSLHDSVARSSPIGIHEREKRDFYGSTRPNTSYLPSCNRKLKSPQRKRIQRNGGRWKPASLWVTMLENLLAKTRLLRAMLVKTSIEERSKLIATWRASPDKDVTDIKKTLHTLRNISKLLWNDIKARMAFKDDMRYIGTLTIIRLKSPETLPDVDFNILRKLFPEEDTEQHLSAYIESEEGLFAERKKVLPKVSSNVPHDVRKLRPKNYSAWIRAVNGPLTKPVFPRSRKFKLPSWDNDLRPIKFPGKKSRSKIKPIWTTNAKYKARYDRPLTRT